MLVPLVVRTERYITVRTVADVPRAHVFGFLVILLFGPCREDFIAQITFEATVLVCLLVST